jgi:aminoglycoside phosphotransferase (APT) family kinase protein
VRRVLATDVHTIQRFPTGLGNYVYDVITQDGQNIVVRIAPDETSFTSGGIYWYHHLKPLGIPLPKLLHYEIEDGNHPFSFIIMERLPGMDLGHVYPELSAMEKRVLAKRIGQIQRIAAQLPQADGFGWLSSYEDRSYHKSWTDLIFKELADTQQRIQEIGLIDPRHVDRVVDEARRFEAYFAKIKPTPFLDDTTTKNVIIHNGQLSGIVDVDWVCFGDPLLVVALTRMSLLSSGFQTDYIDYWCDELNLTTQQDQVLQFYTAYFCVDFMSEIGQAFNKDQPATVDNKRVKRLLGILDQLLAAV